MTEPFENLIEDYGNRIQAIVKKERKNGCPIAAWGRALEEFVEGCLEGGLTPSEIQAHVMDAIYNECAKGKVYPSEYKNETKSMHMELGDLVLQIANIIKTNNLKWSEILYWADKKMLVLELNHSKGLLDVSNKGLIYRKID